jgi:hypothetical protein
MARKGDLVSLTVRLPREQVKRLNLLRDALKEQFKKDDYTMSDLLEQIINDFLEAK